MIGLDTNVLVRYIVQDDQRQSRAAERLIESECTREDSGFVSHAVLAELCWVLERGYGYAKPVLIAVLSGLLTVSELRVQQARVVWRALRAYESGNAGISDYLIAAIHEAEGCEATCTFDRKAAKSDWHRLVS